MDEGRLIKMASIVEIATIILAVLSAYFGRLDASIFFICVALLISNYMCMLFYQLILKMAEVITKQSVVINLLVLMAGLTTSDTVEQETGKQRVDERHE